MKKSVQKKKWKRKKGCVVPNSIDAGFSFVETMAVLVVTAFLAGQATVAVQSLIQKARVASARSQIEQLRVALQSYYVDCSQFPTEEQGLSALWEKPVLIPVSENWQGPYLQRKIPQDPWGNPYAYFTADSPNPPDGTPAGLPYVIVSYGSDLKEGGEGNAKDIISWQ